MQFQQNEKHRYYTYFFVKMATVFAISFAFAIFLGTIYCMSYLVYSFNSFLIHPLSHYYPWIEMIILTIAFFMTLWFLPLGHNLITWWMPKKISSGGKMGEQEFFVEIKLNPPLVKGFRRFIDDNADDVGILFFAEEKLFYQGDLVQFECGYDELVDIDQKMIGPRYLWMGGKKNVVSLVLRGGLTSISIINRNSFTLAGIWSTNAKIKRLFEGYSNPVFVDRIKAKKEADKIKMKNTTKKLN